MGGLRAWPGLADHAVLLLHAPQQQQALTLGGAASRPAGRVRAMASTGGVDVPPGQELAVLGGGCFWCIEAAYRMLKGVSRAESGYAGGHLPNPTYQQVRHRVQCMGAAERRCGSSSSGCRRHVVRMHGCVCLCRCAASRRVMLRWWPSPSTLRSSATRCGLVALLPATLAARCMQQCGAAFKTLTRHHLPRAGAAGSVLHPARPHDTQPPGG